MNKKKENNKFISDVISLHNPLNEKNVDKILSTFFVSKDWIVGKITTIKSLLESSNWEIVESEKYYYIYKANRNIFEIKKGQVYLSNSNFKVNRSIIKNILVDILKSYELLLSKIK